MTTEVSLTSSDTISCYGHGYHFLVKQGFNGQGCGKHKQGIQKPLQNGGMSILMDWDLILNTTSMLPTSQITLQNMMTL